MQTEVTEVSGFASLRPAVSAILMGLALAVPSTGFVGPAAAAPSGTIGPSGLPLPRFVSLKSGKVNSRIGPGVNYPVDWLYLKPGLPMEIIQEYDNWRRVRDADGAEGWINQSLLSGARTAITAPWQRGKPAQINLLAKPEEGARTVAIIDPGVIGSIKQCNGQWCEMSFSGTKGWLNQSQLWGAYPGESIED
ncbi:SH3 domain-containing protein [Mesorhizobium sp. ANAO-SY3R2]|uniref:SH3 domain-containing protein n=1 Tax=Mesorhizobium sp. ANAO-SY3R2 TaxID=3166644 RepID=UPI00366F7352